MGLNPNNLPSWIRNKMAPADQEKIWPALSVSKDTLNISSTRPSEKEEQYEFLKDLIRLKRERRISFRQNRMDMATTGPVGEPDFIIYLAGGAVLFFEFKVGGRKLTKEQENERNLLEFLGHKYYIVRSAGDAWRILEKYL